MSHDDDVDDAIAYMQSMGKPKKPPAAQTAPPPPRSPQEPVEPPVPPAAPEEPPALSVPPQRPRAARAKPSSRKSKASASEAPASNKKIRYPVMMDPDLIALMTLARPALTKKTHQIFFDAARRYRDIAADLPDTPLVETVLDDEYDDVITAAAHRTTYSAYVTPKASDMLDANAEAVGLDRSEFMRRTLRRLIAVEMAFVPAPNDKRLEQSSEACEEVMKKLQTRMDLALPAAVLPTVGNLVWVKVDLVVGTPLRALTNAALQTMPGCTSATQALLTVL